MKDQIHFNPKMLVHEGGTKFYEVVEIWRPSASAHLLIRRWGKMSQQAYGGNTKIESFSAITSCTAMADSLKEEKRKRGYSRVYYEPFDKLKSHFLPNLEFSSLIMKNYGVDEGYQILELLSVTSSTISLEPVDAYDDAIKDSITIPIINTYVEPVRTSEWGSW